MTGIDQKRREALLRLADFLVEDVLAASDDEIRVEFAETHGDLAKNSAAMLALFEKSVIRSHKDRLRAAQSGLAASRKPSASNPKMLGLTNVRDRLRRALAACPEDIKLTLAARNENELSDADILGMLEDLAELGILPPDDAKES